MKTLIATMSGFPDGFAIINKQGRILYWNPALEVLTGIDHQKALLLRVWEIQAQLMPTVYTGVYLDSQRRFWETRKTKPFLRSILKSSGSYDELTFETTGGPVIVSLKTVFTETSERSYFISVFIKDITAQKQRESELLKQGRAANHELRTPLNAVIGFANLLLDDVKYGLTETARPYVQIIRDGGNRALGIINKAQLLDRLELGGYLLPKEEVNLKSFLMELTKAFPQIERTHGVKIELLPDLGILKRDGQPTKFLADSDLLQSVLSNLIVNASEAAVQDNKNILITVHAQEQLTFVVHNYGTVCEEIRPKLFKKHATFGKANGNGLGLYLSRLIAEAHNGSISYSSENGSTFFVVQIPLK